MYDGNMNIDPSDIVFGVINVPTQIKKIDKTF
jgi:hypothetical protein